jgi:predicted porin
MNKKLMAVAVAGALAAPGLAFAQASSVTISGFFKVGLENINYSNSVSTRLNSSQNRVVDNSSRIIFNSVEDLGNGLSAIGQLDVRFDPSQASTAPTSNPIGSGNSYVGLRSTSWGTLTTGRWDLHYGKGPSEMTRGAGALEASDCSITSAHFRSRTRPAPRTW